MYRFRVESIDLLIVRNLNSEITFYSVNKWRECPATPPPRPTFVNFPTINHADPDQDNRSINERQLTNNWQISWKLEREKKSLIVHAPCFVIWFVAYSLHAFTFFVYFYFCQWFTQTIDRYPPPREPTGACGSAARVFSRGPCCVRDFIGRITIICF